MSETNFTKLFSSITASTIWSESAETKVVWITMLAMSDAAGFVYASVPGLSKISGVSMDETIKALELLMSPDKWSRDKDNEGRRIEEIDGGWAILNHPKYRKRRDAEERKAYHREYMRAKRAKDSVNVGVNNVKECEPPSTQGEGEAEEDTTKAAKAALSPPACPYTKIIETYHQKLPMLPKVITLTDKRKSHIKARWINGADNLKFWEDYFSHVGNCNFLIGKSMATNGRKTFIADIDFLIREDVMVKTQEGKYDG